MNAMTLVPWLRRHPLRWQVGGRWYTQALLTLPLLMLAVLWLVGLVADRAISPRFQWPLFAIGLVAGTFEEIGWTGLATPHLLQRWRPFVAGLSLGLMWALWLVVAVVIGAVGHLGRSAAIGGHRRG